MTVTGEVPALPRRRAAVRPDYGLRARSGRVFREGGGAALPFPTTKEKK